MYAQDYDGVYCRAKQIDINSAAAYDPTTLIQADTETDPAKQRKIWAGVLQPYIKNTQVFICPSAKIRPVSPYGGYNFNASEDTLVNDAQMSVGLNAGLDPLARYDCYNGVQTGNFGACTGQISEASATFPSQTPSFADSYPTTPDPTYAVYKSGLHRLRRAASRRRRGGPVPATTTARTSACWTVTSSGIAPAPPCRPSPGTSSTTTSAASTTTRPNSSGTRPAPTRPSSRPAVINVN